MVVGSVRDKAKTRIEDRPMDFDVSKAALPALWKSDPAFQELCKFLYGPEADLESVTKDLFGKTPSERDRRKRAATAALSGVGAAAGVGGLAYAAHDAVKLRRKGLKLPLKTKALIPLEIAGLAGEVAATHILHGDAKRKDGDGDGILDEEKRRKYEVKAAAAPDQADLNTGTKRKKVLKDVKVVGKAWIELVEKAYEEGLISDEGDLNWDEINKSRDYIRDKSGKFAPTATHTARHVGSLALAGGLAVGGAALASKSPKMAAAAAHDLKYVTRHLSHPNPAERHAARALLPHALKQSGKAMAAAGVGATAGAGGVVEGTRAYTNLRDEATRVRVKHPKLEEKSAAWTPGLRAAAHVMGAGVETAEHVAGHIPKHAKTLGRLKRLRLAASDGVRNAVMNPAGTSLSIVDLVKHEDGELAKADRQYKRSRDGRFAEAGGYLAAAGGVTAGLAHGEARAAQHNLGLAQAAQGDAMIRSAFDEPLTTDDRLGGRIHPSVQSWEHQAQVMEHRAKELKSTLRNAKRVRGGGLAATAVGAGLVGAAAYSEHKKNYEPDVTWEGEFSKIDEDKQQVFGWASVTEMDGKPVIDLQGDYIHPDEMERAAYDYVLKARVGGDMHARVDEEGNLIEKADKPYHVSDLIESMVFTPEKCEA